MASNEDVEMKVQPATPGWNQPTSVGATSTGAAGNGTPGNKKMFPQKFAGVGKAKPKPVSNAIKKKRTNYRLRKIIIPKAPLMVLNEMVGSVNYNFIDNPPMPVQPGMPHLFTAQCTVDGEVFTGTGPSKQIAKNICAEHAIQAIVSKRCSDSKNKVQLDAQGNPLKPNQMEDETPWAQLASLALFKLFNDWQAQGYQLPQELLKPPTDGSNSGENDGLLASADMAMQTGSSEKPKKQAAPKKMPDNPTERHPVQLLNEVQGGNAYAILEESGTPPNLVFVMGTEINGVMYKGEGKSKKDAKRNCAINALKQIYNITYPSSA